MEEQEVTKEYFSEKINDILENVEASLWIHEEKNLGQIGYTDEGFRGAVKIFMSVITDRMWDLQTKEKMDMEDREKMGEVAGQELRKFIKKFTNIETFDLYKS